MTREVLGSSRDIIRRTRLETKADILRLLYLNGPMLRTHILFQGNLSWNPLIEYLADMEKKGLVELMKSPDCISYMITEKGAGALRAYKEAQKAFA